MYGHPLWVPKVGVSVWMPVVLAATMFTNDQTIDQDQPPGEATWLILVDGLIIFTRDLPNGTMLYDSQPLCGTISSKNVTKL